MLKTKIMEIRILVAVPKYVSVEDLRNKLPDVVNMKSTGVPVIGVSVADFG